MSTTLQIPLVILKKLFLSLVVVPFLVLSLPFLVMLLPSLLFWKVLFPSLMVVNSQRVKRMILMAWLTPKSEYVRRQCRQHKPHLRSPLSLFPVIFRRRKSYQTSCSLDVGVKRVVVGNSATHSSHRSISCPSGSPVENLLGVS